jgi:hypothetical protein
MPVHSKPSQSFHRISMHSATPFRVAPLRSLQSFGSLQLPVPFEQKPLEIIHELGTSTEGERVR